MTVLISILTTIVVICIVLLTISNIYSKEKSQKIVSDTYKIIKNILLIFFFLISGIFIFIIISNGVSASKSLLNELPIFLKLSFLAMIGFALYSNEQEKVKHKEWWSKATDKEKKDYLKSLRNKTKR